MKNVHTILNVEEPKDEASMLAQGKDYYMHHKFDDAYNLFSQAAELGNQEAKYYMALSYYNGSNDKDEKKLMSIMESLATNGYLMAYYHLGTMYEKGLCAIEENEILAQTYYKKAFPAIKENAEKGDALCQFRLGGCHSNGRGVEKDETKEPGEVLEVLQKGYMYKDRVLRIAMVKVNE